MPFLGKQPTAGFASIVKDDLTADGSTTAFTLSKQVANANDIAVFVGNVRQEPTDAYSVSGTTLTMTAAPASGINFYVLHIAGTVESSVIPADNTISTAKIQASAVTDAKIAGMSSSKLTGALPALDGSALTDVGGLVQLGSTTIASGSAGTGLFDFDGIFSSTYDTYKVFFHLTRPTASSPNILYCRFGNSGTLSTASQYVRGASVNQQIGSGSTGTQYYASSTGVFMLAGTLPSGNKGSFHGEMTITNPNSSERPTTITCRVMMTHEGSSSEASKWVETGGASEDIGDIASRTDLRVGVIAGSSAGSNTAYNAPEGDVYGTVTVYGVKQ